MNYVKGDYASTHTHPNEQSGYVIFGKYLLKIEDSKDVKYRFSLEEAIEEL